MSVEQWTSSGLCACVHKGLDTSVPRDGVRRCRRLEILDKLRLPSEIAKGRMLEREYPVESDVSVKD